MSKNVQLEIKVIRGGVNVDVVNDEVGVDELIVRICLESINADIAVSFKEVTEVVIKTVNGLIKVAMALPENSQVEVISVGSSIDLVFQNNVAARFEIGTDADGTIENNITKKAKKKAKYGPRRWLEFSTSNSTGTIQICMVHGRV